MVKILFCGDIDSNFDVLLKRVTELQNSQHGPFDLLFSTGLFFKDSDEINALGGSSFVSPIPLYILDSEVLSSYSAGRDAVISKLLQLNITVLNGCGLQVIQNLTVAYMSHSALNSEAVFNHESQVVKDAVSVRGYRGCDILLTPDWARDFYHFLSEEEIQKVKESGASISIGSQSCTTLAVTVKPRYHFVGKRNAFFQRSPYKNTTPASAANGFVVPPTRLIALAKVSASKDKNKKWVHALSLEPLTHLGKAELGIIPDGTTECPYVEVGASVTGKRPLSSIEPISQPHTRATSSVGSQGGPQKILKTEDMTSGGGGRFFFGIGGYSSNGSKTSGGGPPPINLVPPHSSARTLFVGGLPNVPVSETELLGLFVGAQVVRRPEGKSFAFVEFSCFQDAKAVIDYCVSGKEIVLHGRALGVGWAASDSTKSSAGSSSRGADTGIYGNGRSESSFSGLNTVPTSDLGKVLYVTGLPFEAFPQRELVSLFAGAISCRRVEGKPFAFVDFDSFDNAQSIAALAAADSNAFVFKGNVLSIGWARGSGRSGDASKRSGGTGDGGQGGVQGSLDPPSASTCTLYVGDLPPVYPDELDYVTEEATVSQARVPEAALYKQSETDLIALFCNAVNVRRPVGQNFAFVEFATSEDAQVSLPLSPLPSPFSSLPSPLSLLLSPLSPLLSTTIHWFPQC